MTANQTTGQATTDQTAVTGSAATAATATDPTRQVSPVGGGSTPRPKESLDELCERFQELCASSVDPLEIAADLEADGLSDQAARVRYGFRDVFSLAEEMYRRVPRQPSEPAPGPDPWRAPAHRHALHGLLFGLPALCYPVASSVLGGGRALTALVVVTMVSWALSQSLSYLGYARLSQLDPDGSRRVLRRGLVVATLVLAVVVALLITLLQVRIPAALLAGGQGVYLLAATVLLVSGADLWLLAGLAPAAVLSALFLLAGEPGGQPHRIAWLALGVSLLAVVVMAVVRTSWPRPKAGRRIRSAELREALPYAGFGAAAAALLVFPLVAYRFSHGGLGGSDIVLLATLPLSLSMGFAEWLLYWYRRRMDRVLRGTRVVSDFAVRARLALVSALIRYVVAAALLIVALIGIAAALGHLPVSSDLLSYGGYLAIGGALFLALVMQAFGAIRPVIGWCAAAVVAEAALVATAPEAPVLRVQLVIGVALLWALLMHAGVLLGRVSRHQ